MKVSTQLLNEISARPQSAILGLPTLITVCVLFFIGFVTKAGFAETSSGLVDYLGDPKFPDAFWQVSSPENEGMDGERLRTSLDFIRANNLHVHSFLVIKSGKLVFEQYGFDYSGGNSPYIESSGPHIRSSDSVQQTPDVRHHMFSTTKTFTSALIGIAIAEEKIPGVKTQAMRYFAQDKIDNLDKSKRRITIEDLLTMRSGLDFDEEADGELFFYGLSNSSLSVLSKPMFYPPGILWYYTSGNSQVLAEIIGRTTGKSPLEYAKEKIFDKIGIKTYIWRSDKSGTQYGGFGLLLRPRDLAKFGYLYLKKGKWGDVTVVPEGWVDETTKVQSMTPWPDGDYGYHCWIPRFGGFATRGRDGQTMYVFPEKDLIVVFTADIPSKDGYATRIEDSIVRNYVLSACP